MSGRIALTNFLPVLTGVDGLHDPVSVSHSRKMVPDLFFWPSHATSFDADSGATLYFVDELCSARQLVTP